METLELDTPSDTVSIPESMPQLENFSVDSSYWEQKLYELKLNHCKRRSSDLVVKRHCTKELTLI